MIKRFFALFFDFVFTAAAYSSAISTDVPMIDLLFRVLHSFVERYYVKAI